MLHVIKKTVRVGWGRGRRGAGDTFVRQRGLGDSNISLALKRHIVKSPPPPPTHTHARFVMFFSFFAFSWKPEITLCLFSDTVLLYVPIQ